MTVEIPQAQFLDKSFADCGYWHIDKAVDVPVISSLAPVLHLHQLRDSTWTRQRSFHHVKLAPLTTMMKVWVMTTTHVTLELRMSRRWSISWRHATDHGEIVKVFRDVEQIVTLCHRSW